MGFLKSGVLGSGRVPRLFPLLKDVLVVPHGMSARSNEAATVDRCLPGKFQLIVGQLTGSLKNSCVMQCPRENNVFAPTLKLSIPQCDGHWEGDSSLVRCFYKRGFACNLISFMSIFIIYFPV